MQSIKENVMEKINKEEIKMKSKYYFIFGSVLSLIGLTASVVTSIFLISILSFSLRAHGPMGEVRLNLMLSSFPIWIPVVAILGILGGVYVLRQYDFSYKSNFWLIIIGLVFAVILSGVLLDITRLNNLWMKKGPMREYMQEYLNNSNIDSSHKSFGPGNGRRNGGFRDFESK